MSMRLLTIFIFATLVQASGSTSASQNTEVLPDKISTSPLQISTVEDDDWITIHPHFFFSFATGMVGGLVRELNTQQLYPYIEARFYHQDSLDYYSTAAIELTTSGLVILDLGKQTNCCHYFGDTTYVRFAIAPVLVPAEGISTISNLRRTQARVALGWENLYQGSSTSYKVGAEIIAGYSLLGLSYDAKLILRF